MRIGSLVFIMGVFGLIGVGLVQAQDFSSGIAQVIDINDERAQDGMVICAAEGGFKLCNIPYATSMFGVVTDTPAGYYDPPQSVQNGKYVLGSGVVATKYVLGQETIRAGDMVTTSEVPGEIQKAKENGYVLGAAIRDANPTTGKVDVAINIHPEAELASSRSNLIAVLREGTKAPILSPLDSLRYLIAALLIIASFVIGFIYFGRMANTGVEAIGRNPLAGKQIQLNMFLHIGITIVIVLIGLFLSYLVLIV